ncbi:hypothetical protein GIB67_022308 [Kingdonia uniflora]|uniref:Aminotransferase-like plant mobile domain-containing protein n=1 Tax=Kingdonia uniflora TaxID=39325 RepID=A0A7J7KW55_9MAGN|nr:hypothetical protein GIB67_022308 [Kingdonia uniflora]
MSLEDEEYDRTGDEEGSESDYSEGHVSQLRFLSGKKQKNDFEEVVNSSIEPPPPLPQNYEARDFRQLTQPDGNGHLSTSVATTSRLKATNLMSVFDCKIGNVDNQVILAMIERWWPTTHTFYLPCGELGITPRDFTVLTGIGIGTGESMEFDESSTDYGNAIRVFPDIMPTDYEKGCISFAHFRTYLDHTKVNIRDPDNAKTIFRAFMLLYFGGVLFGNSKSQAQLELLCPIAILENKDYTIDFGSAILGHLYYCLDQASKQEVKYIGGLFQLIEYHCYKYCHIGHHILIDNRQQLDVRTINNMQWDPFRNMKDALKQKVIITGNISRKRVLLQFPFHGYEWYLGDRCWAQLEHHAVPYDPLEKLHCFPSSDVVRSLRAADFSTQETQIPPPRLGDYPGWIMELGSPHGTTWHTIPSIASTSTIDVPTGYDFFAMTEGMWKLTLDRTLNLKARHLHDESRITQLTENLRHADDPLSQLNEYLDGEGIEVEWEDEAGTSQAGTSRRKSSRGRGSRGRTSEGGAAPPRRSRRTRGSFV